METNVLAACSLEHSPAPTWTQPEHPAGDECVCVGGGEGKTQEVDVTLQTKKTRMDLSVFLF